MATTDTQTTSTVTRAEARTASEALWRAMHERGGSINMEFRSDSPISAWALMADGRTRGMETRPSDCDGMVWAKVQVGSIGHSQGGFTVDFYRRGCGTWFPVGNIFLA